MFANGSRRRFLETCSTGFGAAALTGLLNDPAFASAAGLPAAASLPQTHHPPRVKHVIFCYMSGGVSHVDSFDPKPKLKQLHGQPMPVEVERTQFNNNGNIMASPFAFQRAGESGLPVSEIFPELANVADELAVIRSMTTSVNEHAQGNFVMHSGFPFMGHPSAGAWCSYGLGSENQNLPGYVVLQSGSAVPPHGGVSLFSSGFLPAQHQGSVLQADQQEAIRNIQRRGPAAAQRRRLTLVDQLDTEFLAAAGEDPQVEAAINNYETAFRMQTAVPELCDLSGESESTQRRYGQSLLRAAVLAGTSAGRTGRAVRRAQLPDPRDRSGGRGKSLGSTRSLGGGASSDGQSSRSADHRLDPGPARAGLARSDLDRLGGRVRPHPLFPRERRTGPQSVRLQCLAGRGRRSRRQRLRSDRRARLPGHRGRLYGLRSVGNRAASVGRRSRTFDVPLQRSRLSPDRCPRKRLAADFELMTSADDPAPPPSRAVLHAAKPGPRTLRLIGALLVASGGSWWFGQSPDLTPAATRALFILVLAAGLWLTEAIPPFAVGILVIALQISLLGRPGGVFAETDRDWEQFVSVIGHPLI